MRSKTTLFIFFMATNSYLKPFILLIIIVSNLMGFAGNLWAFVLP